MVTAEVECYNKFIIIKLKNMIKKFIITSISIFGLSYLLSGISVNSFWTALIVSLVLGLLNTFLRPILLLFSLPINIITLGLFTFVINAFIIIIADYLIADFRVANFLWALLLSLIISLINSLTDIHR